jgi:hypothetical protein
MKRHDKILLAACAVVAALTWCAVEGTAQESGTVMIDTDTLTACGGAPPGPCCEELEPPAPTGDWQTGFTYDFKAYEHDVRFDGRYFFDAARGDPWVTTVSNNPALNPPGQVQVAVWALPTTTDVPEPSVLSMLLLSLAALGV